MPVSAAGMPLTEVHRILDVLEALPCVVWMSGGWGVDALVGHQTRPHRDLDLGFDASREVQVLAALQGLGYAVETDWRPVRVELVAPTDRWVDLHPVVLDADGDGVQAGFDGAVFTYPLAARRAGLLGGREVPCLSVMKQLELHRGYEPRPVDLHDLAVLEALSADRSA